MKYVAMIRGIGPENPNMRGEKLRWAFEQMGFTNVRSFLTSGNVLFESDTTDTTQLEKTAETALPRLLDFEREVLVRSQADLQAIVDADPFKGLTHQNVGKTYLTVTFFKNRISTPDTRGIGPGIRYFDTSEFVSLPHRPEGKSFTLLSMTHGALCCVVDLSAGRTPDLMVWLDRHFTKSITTRTYATVTRLLSKMA
ncbi:MAG TPA: DUF1697 domain-containing protein [Candidatus Saccharimonadales bacterium]|nr:DUF1697 domain-containing protein [Candidatus Saccharimonadales bacterium]